MYHDYDKSASKLTDRLIQIAVALIMVPAVYFVMLAIWWLGMYWAPPSGTISRAMITLFVVGILAGAIALPRAREERRCREKKTEAKFPPDTDFPYSEKVNNEIEEIDMTGYPDDTHLWNTYTVPAMCMNCGWKGIIRQSKGRRVMISSAPRQVAEIFTCPRCECEAAEARLND